VSTREPFAEVASAATHVVQITVAAVSPTASPEWEAVEVRIGSVAKGPLVAGTSIIVSQHVTLGGVACFGHPPLRAGGSYIAALVNSTRGPGGYEVVGEQAALIPETTPGTFALRGRDRISWADAAAMIGGRP